LFSSTLRRPPRPTLVPYTTLFRSRTVLTVQQLSQRLHLAFDSQTLLSVEQSLAIRREGCLYGLEQTLRVDQLLAQRTCRLVFAGDRKSTRLNSSHVKISYAVFCLK